MNGSPPVGVAFLLAQLGAYATAEFASALEGFELTPALAGILRILRTTPHLSQQELAERIGMLPSRLVAVVDDLVQRGWVTRTRDESDRRINRLALTDDGEQAFGRLAAVARGHEARMTQGLTRAQAQTLRELLGMLAAQRGLTPGVHPGYRQP